MKPDKRKLAIFAIVLGTVLTGAGLFTWHWYETGRFIEETDDGYVKADVIDVRPEIAGSPPSLCPPSVPAGGRPCPIAVCCNCLDQANSSTAKPWYWIE